MFSKPRREMVEKAIVARGVRSELILSAMRSVPREAFLPHQLREFAYVDCPLPIEEGQFAGGFSSPQTLETWGVTVKPVRCRRASRERAGG